VLGTQASLDLPALGTNPLKKNLLLEFDWFNDDSLNFGATVCGTHSHRSDATQVGRVETVFANANVPNPDGTTGIDVISDFGQGGAFTGGIVVNDADGILPDNFDPDDNDFDALKATNFAANRNGFFHYVVSVHQYINSANRFSCGVVRPSPNARARRAVRGRRGRSTHQESDVAWRESRRARPREELA
jgi:hypothetical protein